LSPKTLSCPACMKARTVVLEIISYYDKDIVVPEKHEYISKSEPHNAQKICAIPKLQTLLAFKCK
jgi:hypothetical protein